MTTHRARATTIGALAALSLLLGACSSTTSSTSPTTAAPTGSAPKATSGGSTPPGTGASTAYPHDDTLKLNMIQTIGSHNSYHVRTPQALRDEIDKVVPGVTNSWNYGHPALGEQFSNEGVRQIELDVHLDPDGRYAVRHALPMAKLPADGPAELKVPGLKVFHIQELDYESNCLTFVKCLEDVEAWSDANPGHVPLMILVELKADKIPDPLNLNFTQPVDWDAASLDQVDADIRKVFDESQMITPDQVRGSHKTLEEAVLAGDWPTLGASRGKVLFALDNSDLSKVYAEGHPSLEGRAAFTNGTPGNPDAAFVKRNDPVEDGKEIDELVKKGYVVRTLVDGDPKIAQGNDRTNADAALATGAQWISTDYPVPDDVIGSPYVVELEGATPARCNPITAPKTCTPADIEDPQHLSSR